MSYVFDAVYQFSRSMEGQGFRVEFDGSTAIANITGLVIGTDGGGDVALSVPDKWQGVIRFVRDSDNRILKRIGLDGSEANDSVINLTVEVGEGGDGSSSELVAQVAQAVFVLQQLLNSVQANPLPQSAIIKRPKMFEIQAGDDLTGADAVPFIIPKSELGITEWNVAYAVELGVDGNKVFAGSLMTETDEAFVFGVPMTKEQTRDLYRDTVHNYNLQLTIEGKAKTPPSGRGQFKVLKDYRPIATV